MFSSSSKFRVRLDATPLPNPSPLPTSLPTYSISAISLTAPNPAVGSFAQDPSWGYDLYWKDAQTLKEWMNKEEDEKTIEFSMKEVRKASSGKPWLEKHIYVCGREFTGGKNKYEKKHDRKRKVGPKRIGCPVRLTVKSYPTTTELRGKLTGGSHTHKTGRENARFMRLRKETRKEIERLLRLGVEPKKVVC